MELVDELKAAGMPAGPAFFRVRSVVVRTPEYQVFPTIADGIAGWCLERYFSGPTSPQRGPAAAMKCLTKYAALNAPAFSLEMTEGTPPSNRFPPSRE